jgi:hypothetical protein
LKDAYAPAFEQLHSFISYSVRRSTDFGRLEREARALIQTVNDRMEEIQNSLEAKQQEAESVLETVRKVAEEQGVSQQAIYFKNESDMHEGLSRCWLWTTIGLTILLVAYAVLTLFLHKWITPTNVYETAQLAVSKVLIFVTISFFLILSSRTYLAHRHNLIVNRHRQNALSTYQAIVKAAGKEANRDVILAKAADCIFTAQPTAFSKFEGMEGGSVSLVNVPGGINPTVQS